MTTMQMSELVFLGQSGTTNVFSAFIGESEKQVALKQIKESHFGNRHFRKVFPEMAASWSQYHHPSLARIYKVDAESIQVVLELFETCVAKSPPETADEVWRILFESLQGLQYLHRQGVLHLNIKPSNILRTSDGDYKLSDGLCFPPGDHHSGINANFRFYAPEQTGAYQETKPSTDLYALGMVMLDQLGGEMVDSVIQNSVGRSEALLWMSWLKRTDHDNPLLKEIFCDFVPEPLGAIIDRLTRKDPAKRYRSCAEVIQDLMAIRAQIPKPENKRWKDYEPRVLADAVTTQKPERDWSQGIEFRILSGAQTGTKIFSKKDFRIGNESDCQLKLQQDDYPEIASPFLVSRDGSTWNLSGPAKRAFVINNRATSSQTEIKHGDIVRLGPYGPDLMVARRSSSTKEIVEMTHDIIAHTKKQSADENRHREIQQTTDAFGAPTGQALQDTEVTPEDFSPTDSRQTTRMVVLILATIVFLLIFVFAIRSIF